MTRVLNARVVARRSNATRRYIGRPDPLGNSFVIGQDGSRMEVITKYREWAPKQSHVMAALSGLVGRDLVCWCAPLLDMVRRYVCEKA